ncbi:MAG TPA: hypothetical protein VLH84_05940 [Patescibacteria group bacterium]|nr:hypothetical protein [Patescibacteria group bacterium]
MAQEDSSDQEENPRGHHAPEHAETKHDRVMEGTKDEESKAPKFAKHKQWWTWALAHKKISIPVAIVVLVGLLAAVPFTRYELAGLVLKQNFAVTVIDSQTSKPVTSATVMLGGKTVSTDSKGHATLHVKVGTTTLEVSKTYYKTSDSSVTVPLGKQKQAAQVSLVATGRQVPVVVLNTISGKPVANALVTAGKSEAKTDTKGEATIVVAANAQNLATTVSLSGYNEANVKLKVTAGVDPANTFKVTPAGKVYFLSNLSGKIDVVKTNLDGTARQTVLAGTGSESPSNTTLLASTDWKYLALLSQRDGGTNPKLFLINTSNDQLTTMDEGNATFSVIGWSGHYFVYTVDRGTTVQYWQNNRFAIKSYNAEAGQIAVLDQSQAQGDANSYAYQYFDYPFIVGNKLVYVERWYNYLANAFFYTPVDMTVKTDAIRAVQVDGQNKKDLKTFPAASSGGWYALPSEVNVIYYQHYNNSGADVNYYEYDDGAVKDLTITSDQFYNNPSYKNYLYSPSGNLTFWSESRDGKNVLFVGDQDAKNSKQVATLSDYAVDGWYTDQYLLVSKNGSELYIMPASGITSDSQAFKVTDFRPSQNYYGYHGGY